MRFLLFSLILSLHCQVFAGSHFENGIGLYGEEKYNEAYIQFQEGVLEKDGRCLRGIGMCALKLRDYKLVKGFEKMMIQYARADSEMLKIGLGYSALLKERDSFKLYLKVVNPVDARKDETLAKALAVGALTFLKDEGDE